MRVHPERRTDLVPALLAPVGGVARVRAGEHQHLAEVGHEHVLVVDAVAGVDRPRRAEQELAALVGGAGQVDRRQHAADRVERQIPRGHAVLLDEIQPIAVFPDVDEPGALRDPGRELGRVVGDVGNAVAGAADHAGEQEELVAVVGAQREVAGVVDHDHEVDAGVVVHLRGDVVAARLSALDQARRAGGDVVQRGGVGGVHALGAGVADVLEGRDHRQAGRIVVRQRRARERRRGHPKPGCHCAILRERHRGVGRDDAAVVYPDRIIGGVAHDAVGSGRR